MAGELSVDPAQIQTSAEGLRQTAQSLDAQVQAFQAQVSGLIEPPGMDPVSPLIWAAHNAVFSAAIKCFSSNSSALHGHAAKLDQAASNYRQAEQDNVTAIGQINRSAG